MYNRKNLSSEETRRYFLSDLPHTLNISRNYPEKNIEIENFQKKIPPTEGKNSKDIKYKTFISLLMKHGKKNRALHILEFSLYLFSLSLSIKTSSKKTLRGFSLGFLQKSLYEKVFYKGFDYKETLLFSYNGDFLYKKVPVKDFFPFYKYKIFFRGNYKKNSIFSKIPYNYKPFFFSQNFSGYNRENLNFIGAGPQKTFYNCKNVYNDIFSKNPRVWYFLLKRGGWEKLTPSQKNKGLFCFYKAIYNIKPSLECRTKRFGGSSRQIPATVSEHRQWGYGIRWIIEAAQNSLRLNPLKYQDLYLGDFSPLSPGNPRKKVKFHGEVLESLKLYYKSKNLPLWGKSQNNFLFTRFRKPKVKFPYNFSRGSKPLFSLFLAEALKDAFYKRGPAMEKRNLWYDTAISNRAYLRYRWW